MKYISDRVKTGVVIAAIILPCMLIADHCKGQNSTIKGVVTYLFNKYKGDMPDLGASVFLLDSLKAKHYSQQLSDTFYYGNFYRNLYAGYQKIPDDVKEEIKKWGVEKDEDFKRIDERQMENLFVFENVEETQKTTVDGNGNYSFQIQPGVYYILIRSKNRQDISLSQISGKIYCVKIKVKNGETKDVSHNFNLN